VEGIRTDVKIINLSLFNTDWYIDYMARRKFYDAEPLSLSLKPEQYRDGTRDYVLIVEKPDVEGYRDLREIIRFVTHDDPRAKIRTLRSMENFIPTKKFRIPVDSATVVENGTVQPEDAHLIVDAVKWDFPDSGVSKGQLMVMDFLSMNKWERPVYFTITAGREAYMGLENYFQLDGMVYRLVPIHTPDQGFIHGRVNSSVLYDNLINKFEWGNLNKPGIYLNEDIRRITLNYRNIFTNLADKLIEENKIDSAVTVLDKVVKMLPEENAPYGVSKMFIAEAYFAAGEKLRENAMKKGIYTDQGKEEFEKGKPIAKRLLELNDQNLNYYFSFTGRRADLLEREKSRALGIVQRLHYLAEKHQLEKLETKAGRIFEEYYDLYVQGY